jgi:hypothetical protein
VAAAAVVTTIAEGKLSSKHFVCLNVENHTDISSNSFSSSFQWWRIPWWWRWRLWRRSVAVNLIWRQELFWKTIVWRVTAQAHEYRFKLRVGLCI